MIAVVDDEEAVCKAVVRMLSAAGFSARGYASGQQFLTSWHFDRPDCLILDLQMPQLSGLEVLQALGVAGAQFPVIIITAHDTPSLPEACRKLGATSYLCKPLDAAVLLGAVTSAIAPGSRPASPPSLS